MWTDVQVPKAWGPSHLARKKARNILNNPPKTSDIENRKESRINFAWEETFTESIS
jgi:hypothetical protein